jgi:hypothetical protein
VPKAFPQTICSVLGPGSLRHSPVSAESLSLVFDELVGGEEIRLGFLGARSFVVAIAITVGILGVCGRGCFEREGWVGMCVCGATE